MNATSAMAALLVALAATAAHACPGIDSTARPQFVRPVSGDVFSGFGLRRHPILGYGRMHTGVDYGTEFDEPVRAAAAGEVSVAGEEGDYGRYVRIRHAGGFETAYAQLGEIFVTKGDCVEAGAVIGRAGATETGPHLHFEVLLNGRFLDPVRMRGAPR